MSVTIILTSKVLSMGTDSRKLWYISLYIKCEREGEGEREREERRGKEEGRGGEGEGEGERKGESKRGY